jgi:hypothetical protein
VETSQPLPEGNKEVLLQEKHSLFPKRQSSTRALSGRMQGCFLTSHLLSVGALEGALSYQYLISPL